MVKSACGIEAVYMCFNGTGIWGGETLTAGAEYIRVLIFYYLIKYHLLNIVKIKYDINQQDLKRVDLHFVKFE